MSRRNFGNYKKKVGATQLEAVYLYHKMGMSVQEMQDLLTCPRASIRGRISQLRKAGRIS